MAQFKRSDLHFKNYIWKSTENECSKISGFPHDLYLCTKDGYVLLCFINRYMQARNYTRPQTFFELEKTLKLFIPAKKYTHLYIKRWLDFNFRG